MKKLFFIAFITTLTISNIFAKDVIITKTYLKGAEVIEKFMSGPTQFGDSFEGDTSNCKTFFSTTNDNQDGIFVFISKNIKRHFIIDKKNTYLYIRSKNDGSDGNSVGFFTVDSIKIGKYELRFNAQGDMGYTSSFIINNKIIVECDTGF
jgi:hypothetical protein